jgi:putative acyl-CoA dehydrogenase
MQKTPAVVGAFLAELARARGANAALDAAVAALQAEFRDPADLEYRARHVVDRMALTLQAAMLLRHAPPAVADAFCASRLQGEGHRQFGTLPRGADCDAIIRRATPVA